MHWLFKNRYLLSVLGLSLLPFVFWLTSSDLVHTHDGLVHLPRLFEYYDGLREGIFPVRWAGGLNYNYGLPLFVFIYHTPYLIGSVFLAFGLGVVNAFKITVLLSFLLSGVFMYLFVRRFFNDEKTAFVVALLYQFAPFHLIDVLIRGSFGEVYAYTFLPLVLYFLSSYFSSKKIINLLFASVAAGLLIISHNSISLLFFGVCMLFVLFFGENVRQRVVGILSLLGGMLISAYYWLPAIIEHKYTLGDVYMQDLYSKHFFPIWKILVPNIGDFSLFQIDNLSIHFGLMQVVCIFLGVLWFVKNGKDHTKRKVFIFSGILILASIFFMLPASLFFWENISQLRQFQFPWRFMTVIVFASSLYGVYIVSYLKKEVAFWIVGLVIVFSSIIYWLPKEGYDKVDEKYYDNFPLTSTYYGETDVIWTAGEAKNYPKSAVEIVQGDGEITAFEKKTSSHTFLFSASSPATLVSNTVYFPGWKVYLKDSGQELPIQFQDPNHRGLIQFSLPEGENMVQVVFEESRIRQLGNMASLLGVVLLLGLFFALRNKKYG